MDAIKALLLVEILLLFSFSLTSVTKDAIRHSQCEEPEPSFVQRLSIWIGFEEPENICMKKEEIIQKTVRAVLHAIYVLLVLETFRTVLCFHLLSEKQIHITMSSKSSHDEILVKFCWDEIFRHSPRLTTYSYRDDQTDTIIIRVVNVLTVTTVIHDTTSGKSTRWTSPKLFSC